MESNHLDERPTHLDLFSGIGGFALAAQWAGFRTIGFCEIDKYCQKVLAKNFLADTSLQRCSQREASQEGQQHGARRNSWSEPESPCRIFGNIFDLNGRDFAGVSLITGGFPCQPFSVAGKRGGAADDRAIWPEMFRVISEARPTWVLGENVPGIIPMELDNVLSELEGIGYATRAFVIPACAVDARHRRDRVWVIGRRTTASGDDKELLPDGSGISQGLETGTEGGIQPVFGGDVAGRGEKELADTNGQGSQGHGGLRERSRQRTIGKSGSAKYCQWEPEPAVCGLVDGLSDGLVRYAGRVATKVPNRVQKLKGLGNAIVPQVAYEILREIRKLI